MKHPEPVLSALEDLQWLQRFAARLTSDADDADDLVQETLVASWTSPPRDAGSPLRPWLATVLRNRLRMQRRADLRRGQRECAGAPVAPAAEPEGEAARLEVLRVLLGELERLAPEDQKIVVRRYFAGESAAEIGLALAIPAATVRSRIHRALQRLRGALDRRFGERSIWSAAILTVPPPAITPANVSQGGGEMSVTLKVILVATVGAMGVAGWLAVPGASAPTHAQPEAKELPGPAQPAAAERTPRAAWEQRRGAIRQVLAPAVAPGPVPRAHAEELREREEFRALVHACVEDLAGEASGAVTIEVTKIGAPDIGTIYESVELVETTFKDQEVLQCLIQSMYGWVGEAPSEGFERRYTSTFKLGDARDDAKDQQTFDFIIGAHIGEVRWCEARGEPDVGPVRGQLRLAYGIEAGADGKVKAKTLTVRETDLPPEVVACVVTASERWIFPPALADQVLEYVFVLPVPGGARGKAE